MDILEYKIQKGDTLKSIAEKYSLSVEELRDFHNSHCGVASLIVTEKLPIHLESVHINKSQFLNNITPNNLKESSRFKQKTKYRCEQVNITRIEDDIKSYSQLKKEYGVEYDLIHNLVKTKLNDFYYEFNPPALKRVFDFTSKLDYIRNNSLIEISNEGRFLKVLNKNEQFETWNHFKINELNTHEFVKAVKSYNVKEYENLIQQGDYQFSNKYDDKKDFNKDIFYLVLLDKYLKINPEDLDDEIYDYQSQLFPDVVVPMKVRYDILKNDGKTVTIRKVWETIESDDLLDKVSKGYEKYHQPLIKYKFTSYKLDLRCLFTYELETKLLVNAEYTIIENIENNIKSECIFNLKNIQN